MFNSTTDLLTPSNKDAAFAISYNGVEYFSQGNGGRRENLVLKKISEEACFPDTRIITGHFGTFTRIIISKPPHMAVIADIGENPCISFIAREENLGIHIYNESRLVLRRGDTALKLFSIGTFENGAFFAEKLSNEKSGGNCVFKWESCGNIRVYTAIAAQESDIRGWHVTENNALLHLESPGAADTLDVNFGKNAISILKNEQSAMCIHLSEIAR